MIDIVCYLGGTCGDLVTALIDPRDSVIENGAVKHVIERARLKKPHLFVSDSEKDQYISSVEYHSISSHDVNYHVNRSHDFIAITIQNLHNAVWAAERFKKLHRPHVWEEMSQACGANTVEQYAQIMLDHTNMVAHHSSRTLQLENILGGHAIESLQSIVHRNIPQQSRKFYQDWLHAQNLT